MGSKEQKKDSLEIKKTNFIKDLEIKSSRTEKREEENKNGKKKIISHKTSFP